MSNQTLKGALETLIDRYTLTEVLDRLADITTTGEHPYANQITHHLEKAIEFTLLNPEAATIPAVLPQLQVIS